MSSILSQSKSVIEVSVHTQSMSVRSSIRKGMLMNILKPAKFSMLKPLVKKFPRILAG